MAGWLMANDRSYQSLVGHVSMTYRKKPYPAIKQEPNAVPVIATAETRCRISPTIPANVATTPIAGGANRNARAISAPVIQVGAIENWKAAPNNAKKK
jgi:hypothetical protein